jgi:hypothetical protein
MTGQDYRLLAPISEEEAEKVIKTSRRYHKKS